MSTDSAQDLAFRVEPYFINKRAVLSLLSLFARQELINIANYYRDRPFGEVAVDDAFADAVVEFIRAQQVDSLAEVLLHESLAEGQPIWAEQLVHFQGYDAYRRYDRGRTDVKVPFRMVLKEFNNHVASGEFSPEHIVNSNSARGNLSGNTRLLTFGIVQQSSLEATIIRPLLVGRRMNVGDLSSFPFQLSLYVSPESIDEFSRLTAYRATMWDQPTMQITSEQAVKEWFAEIIGEPVVPKDWGGERSDLWSARVHVDGEPVRAAFLLKGPAVFRELTIADLGRRGDQIDRLFSEPADLLVLQHCHYVRKEVYRMMETYASNFRQPRRYSVIDGPTTWQILKAYNKLQ